jgi:hypothetical protein
VRHSSQLRKLRLKAVVSESQLIIWGCIGKTVMLRLMTSELLNLGLGLRIFFETSFWDSSA